MWFLNQSPKANKAGAMKKAYSKRPTPQTETCRNPSAAGQCQKTAHALKQVFKEEKE